MFSAETAPPCQLLRPQYNLCSACRSWMEMLSTLQHYTIKFEVITASDVLPLVKASHRAVPIDKINQTTKLLLLSQQCNQELEECKEDTNGRKVVERNQPTSFQDMLCNLCSFSTIVPCLNLFRYLHASVVMGTCRMINLITIY